MKSSLQVVHIYFDTATYDEIQRDVKVHLFSKIQIILPWLQVTLEAQLGLIGGTMGLLTGFSILSGVEIIFYILKLVFFLCNNIEILFSGSWCRSTSQKMCKCVLPIGCANVARGRIETQTIFLCLTYFLLFWNSQSYLQNVPPCSFKCNISMFFHSANSVALVLVHLVFWHFRSSEEVAEPGGIIL